MSAETWRPIPGHEGYEASDKGRVRSWRRSGGRRGLPRTTPLVLTPALKKSGYMTVHLAGDHPGSQRVHRLVAAAFLGPCPAGQEVRHLNGQRADNRLANLAYGTRSENMLDAVEHGTQASVAKTHCPRGHAYDVKRQRRRECSTCQREHQRRYAAKGRGATVACPECGASVSKLNLSRHRRRHLSEGVAA